MKFLEYVWKGWNDWILEVIRITIWIFWIHEMKFLKTDVSERTSD